MACAEPEIADAVRAAGGEAVLTRPDHPSGSDRIAEALQAADPEGRHDAVVNMQGDLPTMAPAALRAALAPLADPAVDIGTVVTRITRSGGARQSQRGQGGGRVRRATMARRPPVGRALYFSRLPVPSGDGPHYHHIGIYAYRRAALERFVAAAAGAAGTARAAGAAARARCGHAHRRRAR